MADDKDTYVQGRGNPSLDPTRADPLAFKPWSKNLGGTEWDKGPDKYTVGSRDKLFATDPDLLKLNTKVGDSLLKQTAFGRDSSGLLTNTGLIDQTNKDIAARSASSFVRGKNGFLTLGDPNQPIPKTEQMPPQRDLSGGGAKSGIRPSKKISSFGRGDPTFKSYNPQVFRSGFFRAAVSSAKHFIPQYGLFGTGFHGGPIRIQPMRWEGAFPVMDIQHWDSAGASTAFTEEEEDDE
jgi:hypothetical protein